MKYLLCFILICFAAGIAGPQLWYAHALGGSEAIESGVCLGFAMYLFDPTSFLAFMADMRKTATCWFTRGEK